MILDPDDLTSATDGPEVIGPLPARVQAFGYRPPLEVFEPGDLVLTAHRSEKASATIRTFQSRMFMPSAAAWTHAAVYIKDGIIVEATPRRGIGRSDLHDYVGSHRIALRRAVGLAPEVRREIALDAALQLGKAYDRWMVLTFLRQALSPGFRRNELQRKHAICSQLYADSYLKASKRNLSGCPVDEPVTPAHLAASPDLVPVPLRWVRLPLALTT